MNCQPCEEKHDRIRPGTRCSTWEEPMCEDCRDAASEAAWEQFCEDYYGGSGPVTLQEQYQAAAAIKRSQR